MAYVEVGKSLGLPIHTYMGSSDGKLLDAQAGLESMGGTLLAALAGINMVSGAGMVDYLRCQSLEKLVIDAEIISMVRRVTAGIQKRQESLALELMRANPHSSDFLANPHTMQWMKEELYMPSPLIDRSSYEIWQGRGSKDTARRAAEQVGKLLAKAPPSPLSPELHAELRRIATLAARKNGMDALPDLPDA